MSIRNTEYLTLRLSALGDAILTTGVLEFWHRTRGLRAHVITRQALAPIFENHPAVAEIITVEADQLRAGNWLSCCWHLTRTHGKLPFVDVHDSLRSRVLRLMWPALTFTYPKYSLTRRLFLKTRHPYFSRQLLRYNVPQRYSLALETVAPGRETLRPTLFLTQQERETARQLLQDRGLTRPIAIHPYATHPAKTPPAAVWRELIASLHQDGFQIVVIGRDTKPLLPDNIADLTNQTDLRATAAVLAQCSCLISGDSGPMHLATSVNTPVLALFGPTTPEWGFYPSGPKDIVFNNPCPDAPCSLHGQQACRRQNACMTSISANNIRALLDKIALKPTSLSLDQKGRDY